MGSLIEFNDTLQITSEQGFPTELDLAKHQIKPFTEQDFADKIFEFKNKPDMRLYHPSPIWVFLVHNINGKWLYWGHAQIIEQTIHANTKTTSGKFTISKIYPPDYQKQISIFETDPDKQYFQ